MKNCRICKKSDLEKVLDLGEQPHCNSFLKQEQRLQPEPRWPLELFYCSNCHLVQIGHVVDPGIMFREFLYVSGTTRTLREHFRKSAAQCIDRFALQPQSLVVDIGSNDGTWLKYFKASGMRVVGVDPAENLADMANASGIPTLADFFTEELASRIRNQHGPADLITAAGVFFHIDDMDDVCRGIRILLAEDGVLHVQAIYLGSILEQNSYDNIYHEHLSLYTLHPLVHLFERFGMTIFDVGFSPIHGGSMLLDVCKQGAYPVKSSVGNQLDYERRKGWNRVEAYRSFAEQVRGNREELRRLIIELKGKNKRIAAYAAPAKGNTLLNYCQLGTDLLDYAIEKAPLKIGRYTPGMHLPVVDEHQAMQNPPDYLLLLAWNFKDELVDKNRSFLENGGHFIVPIPRPHII
ncbi:MAG: class I SAM-dependent methyltransferase [Desulfosarcinaceae bacterium]